MLRASEISDQASQGHQMVFSYWSSLRQNTRLPSRSQIDPQHLKILLPTVSLIDVTRGDNAMQYRQRLAGTGLYHIYGREITGSCLEDIYPEGEIDYWRTQLDKVVETAYPQVGCQKISTRVGGGCQVLWIRLPLASDGETVDMVLGYDRPLNPSYYGRFETGIRAA